MVHSGELHIKQWIELIQENLEFETEEQTLAIILDEILHQWKYGLIN